MPVIKAADSVHHHAHGSDFSSFVAPARGSETLCAWRLDIPEGAAGARHRPTKEEVLLVLSGRARVYLDGTIDDVAAGDVVHVPAGSELQITGGSEASSLWVTTLRGIEGVMQDGTRFTPPWAL